jgi:hypothetical protein
VIDAAPSAMGSGVEFIGDGVEKGEAMSEVDKSRVGFKTGIGVISVIV